MSATNRLITCCTLLVSVALYCSVGSLSADTVDTSNPSVLYGETARYGIYRKGKSIGIHTVTFQSEGDKLKVNVESRIRITILKIPVFRFLYTATEIWDNDALLSVQATTVENGETTTVSMRNEDDGTYLIKDAGKERVVDTLPIASNHWNFGVINEPRIFNTLTGEANNVTITSVGKEELELDDRKIQSTHYRYSGDVIADVWYDDANRWVQLRFKGTDGSEISYVSTGFP